MYCLLQHRRIARLQESARRTALKNPKQPDGRFRAWPQSALTDALMLQGGGSGSDGSGGGGGGGDVGAGGNGIGSVNHGGGWWWSRPILRPEIS